MAWWDWHWDAATVAGLNNEPLRKHHRSDWYQFVFCYESPNKLWYVRRGDCIHDSTFNLKRKDQKNVPPLFFYSSFHRQQLKTAVLSSFCNMEPHTRFPNCILSVCTLKDERNSFYYCVKQFWLSNDRKDSPMILLLVRQCVTRYRAHLAGWNSIQHCSCLFSRFWGRFKPTKINPFFGFVIGVLNLKQQSFENPKKENLSALITAHL